MDCRVFCNTNRQPLKLPVMKVNEVSVSPGEDLCQLDREALENKGMSRRCPVYAPYMPRICLVYASPL
jgi:hypothetical protein